MDTLCGAGRSPLVGCCLFAVHLWRATFLVVRAHGFLCRLMVVAVAFVVSGAVTVFGGVGANAAPPPNDGPLILTPVTGTERTTFTLSTPAGCPTTANSYNGLVKGPNGFDGTVVNTLSDKVSFTGPFSVEFSNTMLAVSQFIGKPVVAGEYDIFLNCVDDFTGAVFRSFTTAMYFTDATHYTLTAPDVSATTTTNNSAGGNIPSDPPAETRPRTSTGFRGAPIGLFVLGGSLLVAGLVLLVWRQRRRKAVLGDRE
ncbi:MAG: hypothetical protein ACRDSM_19265 [Pseudonocardiaceae bacterium]